MATFTFEAPGAMNDDATWAGTGTPGVSDQTVNTGGTVTVTATHLTDATGGHDVGSGGTMAIDGGVELRAGGGRLELTGTAILRHSGTGAGAALVGQLAGQIVLAAGTDADNRVQILGVDATQHIRFSQGHTNPGVGRIQLDLCNLEFVGNATNPLCQSNLSTAGNTAYITNSILENCGHWNLYTTGMHGEAVLRFNGNNCTGGAAAAVIRVSANPAALTTGVREIIGTYSDKPLDSFGAINFRDFAITDNYIVGRNVVLGDNQPALVSDNLFAKDTQASHSWSASPLNNYLVQTGSVDNPHFWSSSGSSGTFTADGNVLETLSTVTNGDGFLISGSLTWVIVRNIVLPGGGGGISCSLLSALGSASNTYSADHNSFWTSGGQAGIGTVETYLGHVNMCPSVRSNIAIGSSASGLVVSMLGTPVDDYFGVADFNLGRDVVGDQVFTTNYGITDAAKFAAGTPGPNDVNVDPDLVDHTRDLAAFGASLGGAGTATDTLAELAKMNLSTWNPAYNPAAGVTFVKGGWAPQEPLVEDAGHDGVTIGAMPFLAAAGSTVSPADVTHGHSVESPVLTQAHTLAPAGATHTHPVESPTLTQANVLAPASVTHGHAVESPALTQAHTLAPADVAHGHAVDSPALAQAHALAPADAVHSHPVESPSLTQAGSLSPADATHAHPVDSPSLTQAHDLAPADVTHAHTVESSALTQANAVAPADAVHAHPVDAATLTQAHVLTPAEVAHAHPVEAASLTVAGMLAAQDSTHAHPVEAPTLTQAGALSPDDALHAHSVDSPALAQAATIAPADATHTHTVGSPAMSVAFVLVPLDVLHAHLVGATTLTQAGQLAVDDVLHAHTVDSVSAGIPSTFRLPFRATITIMPR